MTYPALPDQRMPYDDDGTVLYQGTLATGTTSVPTSPTVIEWNDRNIVGAGAIGNTGLTTWLFFPEQREVTALYFTGEVGSGHTTSAFTLAGSNDTTNGLDGTWETATLPGGAPSYVNNFSWRAGIKAVSFTGAKRTIRIAYSVTGDQVSVLHVYGQKAAGQTPDDILFLDGLASYAEFAAPEDFGDVPLATSSVRTFKVKNASATHTANTINLQCNDADFAISTDNVTWVTTINISSLAAGASSAVLYVRNTSPAIGDLLGPRFARIIATVASYT